MIIDMTDMKSDIDMKTDIIDMKTDLSDKESTYYIAKRKVISQNVT